VPIDGWWMGLLNGLFQYWAWLRTCGTGWNGNERDAPRESDFSTARRDRYAAKDALCALRFSFSFLHRSTSNVARIVPFFPSSLGLPSQVSPSFLRPTSVPLTSHPIHHHIHRPPLALIPRFHPSVSPSRLSSPASRLPPPAARAKRRKLRSWGPRGCTVRLDFPCAGAHRLGSLLHIYIRTYIVA
jgi:hypothetical protein